MTDIHKRKFSLESLWRFIRERFSLDDDKASQEEVMESVRKGVEFRGTNLWVLIFATFVASLGLNVNSAAVIIGAMLISPLMGPIMGIGLSLGINDFELLKRSFRNFALMVLTSIVASTLFFFLSPISTAQSELLARTVPTIYDVLIAFFGGLAGIVAQSRKDRTSTVIPGVAIATALMPPLCTAGYGLATLQFTYFIGAFYLFFINTVFIAAATFIVVRFLKYDKKAFLDKRREQKVRRMMSAIILLTIIPSVVIAYNIIRRSFFESNVDRYVAGVFRFSNAQVIDYKKRFNPRGENHVEVMLLGEPVSPEVIDNARAQLSNYNLENTQLIVRQSGETGPEVDVRSLQTSYGELLVEKNRRIGELEQKLASVTFDTLAAGDISREIVALSPRVADVTLARTFTYNAQGHAADTVLLCVLKMAGRERLGEEESERFRTWLETRTRTKHVKIYYEE